MLLDAAGLSGTTGYTYNGAGRLKQVARSGLVLATYGYDAFERRVVRHAGGSVSHYLFDASGRPLAEHDGVSGGVLREYIWLEDMLVALVQGGVIHAVHGGHLGQPLMMTDAGGAMVWRSEFAPFGGALPSVSSEDPGLRFPGQWAEGETGLFQNWHRDYDPSLGRYIEADPLGLAAGQSLYGYVRGDPVNYVDPTGLLLDTGGAGTGTRAGGLARLGTGALAAGYVVAYLSALDAVTSGIDDFYNNLPDADPKLCPVPETLPIPDPPPVPDDPNGSGSGNGPVPPNNPGPDDGDCTPSQRRQLQNDVVRTCKAPPRSCFQKQRPRQLTRNEILERILNGKACVASRTILNNTCYRGGDRAHQIELQRARDALNLCRGRL